MFTARGHAIVAPVVAVSAVATGAFIAGWSPTDAVSGARLATFYVGVIVALVAIHLRQSLIAWDAFAIVLAGLLLLGYGFANVGVLPGVPLPLADVVIAALGSFVLMIARPWVRLPAACVAAGAYVAIATARLVFDFPIWGRGALRDYSLAVELLALPVGFWIIKRYSMARLIRLLRWTFIAVIGYGWLYPAREVLAALGPTVGLQKPITLLGYFNLPALVSAFFFFLIVRPFPSALWIAAAALPPIAILQSRGLFLALPLAAIVVAIAARGETGRSFRSSLVLTAALGAMALSLLFTFSPEGRIGPTNASFIVSQLRTLQGEAGPGAGSLRTREDWLSATLERVSTEPNAWLIGLGLGPDLTDGFTTDDTGLVRKPHNDYLEAYARTGILGLGALVATLALALFPVWSGARRLDDQRSRFLWWVVATAVVFLLVAATQPLLAFPYGTIPLFGALGAGLAITSSSNRRGQL